MVHTLHRKQLIIFNNNLQHNEQFRYQHHKSELDNNIYNMANTTTLHNSQQSKYQQAIHKKMPLHNPRIQRRFERDNNIYNNNMLPQYQPINLKTS